MTKDTKRTCLRIAYVGGIAALAALELVEWPIALVFAAEYLLEQKERDAAIQHVRRSVKKLKKML